METIRSHKINMNMQYTDWINEEHPHMTFELANSIFEKFCRDMQQGPFEEVIRFFNLDPEDIEEIKDDNWTIGWRVLMDDTEQHILNANIKLDVKIGDGNDEEGDTLYLTPKMIDAPTQTNEG